MLGTFTEQRQDRQPDFARAEESALRTKREGHGKGPSPPFPEGHRPRPSALPEILAHDISHDISEVISAQGRGTCFSLSKVQERPSARCDLTSKQGTQDNEVPVTMLFPRGWRDVGYRGTFLAAKQNGSIRVFCNGRRAIRTGSSSVGYPAIAIH